MSFYLRASWDRKQGKENQLSQGVELLIIFLTKRGKTEIYLISKFKLIYHPSFPVSFISLVS